MTSDRDLQAEAADWVARLDAGTARPEDLARWRDADPRRRIAFAQAVAAWEAMGSLASGSGEASPAAPPAREQRNRRAFLRAAAMVGPILAVGGGAAVLLRDDRAHATTVVGEMRRFEATTGLVVELNTDSRIAWKARGENCEIWLEKGEAALFVEEGLLGGVTLHIAEDEVLLAPGGYTAKALGASPEVIVLAGGARASRAVAGTTPIARPGETIRLARGRPATLRTQEDIRVATAWRRGEIIFTGQTLGQAVEEYNRYLERKLVVQDPAVASIQIGGRFETMRPDPFLDALERSFDLRTRTVDGAVIIERNVAAR